MKFSKDRNKSITMDRRAWASFHFDGNTFEVKSEPTAQAMKYPTPNQIVGEYNRAYDVRYLGEMNEADMTVPQATLDITGPIWKTFDIGVTDLSFSYLGLCLENDVMNGQTLVRAGDRNNAFNQQFRATMMESLSAAYATQLTQIAFMQHGIQTDIPELSGVNASGNAFDGSGQIGFTIFYQAMVQNIAALFARYNTLMSYADWLIQCGYNYEAPYTTRLMNLFKKQNVYSLFDQLGVIMQQEYLDLDWYKESTILNTLICKKDKGLQSPALCIVANHRVPHVRVHSGTDPTATNDIIFSTYPSDYNDPYSAKFNQISYVIQNTAYQGDFETVVMAAMRMMDPANILEWARCVQDGTVVNYNANQYINDLIELLHIIIDVMATFRNISVDFKTFLMVLQNQTNLNRWVIGTPYLSPKAVRTQVEPAYYKIIEDIFTAYAMGGPLAFDEDSRKWRVFTPWFNSVGINGYDAYDGGFAIATSVRSVPFNAAGYTGSKYLFPRMFKAYEEHAYDSSTHSMRYATVYPEFVNKIGANFKIQPSDINNATLAANIHFSHLNLTGSTAVTLTVPEATLQSYTTDPVTKATAMKVIMEVYGIGALAVTSGGVTVKNEVIDPDIIGLVGREFGSFSSDSVNYITGRAPLRQMDRDTNIGFVSTALTKA